jgi:hypothetical protein
MVANSVLATVPARVTMHLVAARATPDVAVHIVGAAITSAGKALHAAAAVRLVEVKEPAVEVVAGCLEALVDLLHGLISVGCVGCGVGPVCVDLHPPQPENSLEQMGCCLMRLLNTAGTASMLMVTPAPRRPSLVLGATASVASRNCVWVRLRLTYVVRSYLKSVPSVQLQLAGA